MGTDQGKLGNMHALGIIAETAGVKMGELGTTTFRPPYTPLTFGTIVGRNVGEYFDTFRRTPMNDWHIENKAEFENVGQWKRAWYYPKNNETMHEAVQRESKAARNSAGILDASTLGKIDIQGTDASEFLNRVYTNAWSKLAIGKCRYGLMLNEDGMVYDDGVTTRLDENHYIMTTTTGGAANVLGKLEDYLQTEWPELDVYLSSVTDHYATASICGPNSKKILNKLIPDLDLSDESFPHMSFKNDTMKEDRKQLVGLLTDNPSEVLEEGAQIVANTSLKPVEMLGHVTSSYYSPNLNKSIALAVVRGGKNMLGQKLFIPMENKNINVTIVDPVFFDKENVRLNA